MVKTEMVKADPETGAWLTMIDRAARDPDVSIDKIERLMSMKERLDGQVAVRSFNAAVALAKGDIGPILKNKTVDFTSQKGRTNYKHEDFASVARTVDPVLSAHGLSYRFRSTQTGGKLRITCILAHESGHFEETSLEVGEDHTGNKNGIQAIGSAATYLQRYTLKLALGLSSSDDDDGKAARDIEPVSDLECTAILAALKRTGGSPEKFCSVYHIDQIEDLPSNLFEAAVTKIDAAGRARAAREALHG